MSNLIRLEGYRGEPDAWLRAEGSADRGSRWLRIGAAACFMRAARPSHGTRGVGWQGQEPPGVCLDGRACGDTSPATGCPWVGFFFTCLKGTREAAGSRWRGRGAPVTERLCITEQEEQESKPKLELPLC